jgi:hypothetical protein
MGRNSRHTTEQIVNKLRQVDVELAKGQSISAVCKTTAGARSTAG